MGCKEEQEGLRGGVQGSGEATFILQGQGRSEGSLQEFIRCLWYLILLVFLDPYRVIGFYKHITFIGLNKKYQSWGHLHGRFATKSTIAKFRLFMIEFSDKGTDEGRSDLKR